MLVSLYKKRFKNLQIILVGDGFVGTTASPRFYNKNSELVGTNTKL
ncbi:hypothetical protein LEP1GSC034_0663 [Leptospira interrogans str. 2003000735]|uniref:Uncharacterized protein n=8 Tax=Leptospira interrogans TaxID=173 RepID=M6ZGG5_LEPIR|nr:hypothetical protein [Leptospira interrogans]ALE41007.1 hypothetical protein G436_3863 [Leptospira interrogans serovar Hardjo str. Norma]EJP04192.1 hypothetical protein LEP1GSC007_0282 [Leptospira interrogans serovar Bulgarica str. Mallika]EKO05258.1 hypothetical protein LEP1GSC077_4281 [Leptospira interrogans str. C10069]EKO85603.1 hypothetical protein LEP1GSC009_0066 [Leptospira interrogans serovar Grippotyphosa str. Andaman]EKO94644.1 hypothetical protein LEP1GSC057_4427 [Leptospira inte